MATNKDDDYMKRLSNVLDEAGVRKGDPAEWAREDAEKAKGLLGKESEAANGSTSNDTPATDATRQGEENPSEPTGGYVNNVAGKAQKAKGAGAFFRKRGALIAAGGGVGMLGIGAILLLLPALLFFHLLANMFDTYDPSSIIGTQMVKRMMVSKLGSNSATTGCSTVKIWCRFKTPTNELLRVLKANGIVAVDQYRQPLNIDTNRKWPTQKPAGFQVSSFQAEGGRGFYVEANGLSRALESNSGFRLAFNQTAKQLGNRAFSRWSPAVLGFLDNFRLSLRDTLAESVASETEEGKRTVRQFLADSLTLKNASGEALNDASKAATSIMARISLRINKLLTLLAKASKGSGIVLAMAMQCMASEVPGMIKKTMVSIQEAGILSAASPVVTSMSAIQAGDGTPELANELGTLWTEEDKDGMAATDSIGIRYANHGDRNISSDPSYNNVTPRAFGDTLTNLSLADTILSNPVNDVWCGALMNPISGAAITTGVNLAVRAAQAGSGPPGWVVFAIDAALGVSITVLIDLFGDGIADAIGGPLGGALVSASESTLAKMQQPGPTFGNLMSSGVGLIGENAGAMTSGTAITIDQLPEIARVVQEEEAAEAEIARATLSPFDATSKYTFFGSIANQFLPYYSSLSSIQGAVSMIGSIIPISFGSIAKLSTTGAATDGFVDKYSNACPDAEEVKVVGDETKELAADLFCHNMYGVIPGANWDPVATAQNLAGNGQIDEDTGEAVEDDGVLSDVIDDIVSFAGTSQDGQELDMSYADWFSLCSIPENASQCTGNDNEQQLEYGLYTAAKTVNSMLDMDGNENIENEDATISIFSHSLENSNSTTSSDAESIPMVFGVISIFSDIFRSYGTSLMASFSTPLSDILMRYSLWR